MLREANLVCVVRVGFVRIDGLGAVWVLGGCRDFGLWLVDSCRCLGGRVVELWLRRVAAHGADRTTVVAGDWGGCLEPVELSRSVHLWRVCNGGIWAVVVSVVGNVAGAAHGWLLALVESKGIDVGAVAGIWLGAIVEDPHDLRVSVSYMEVTVWQKTYANHGEEDEAGSGCLLGAA